MISIKVLAAAIFSTAAIGVAFAQPPQTPGNVPCQPGAGCSPGSAATTAMPMERGPGMGQSGKMMGEADKVGPGKMGPGAGMEMKSGKGPGMMPGMGKATPNGEAQDPTTSPSTAKP